MLAFLFTGYFNILEVSLFLNDRNSDFGVPRGRGFFSQIVPILCNNNLRFS